MGSSLIRALRLTRGRDSSTQSARVRGNPFLTLARHSTFPRWWWWSGPVI